MDEPTDLELITRAQASPLRGHQAFGALVRRYERPLFNFILKMVHSRSLAEELFQESFLRAFRGIKSFEPSETGGSVRAWLYQIALNVCRDEVRSSRFQAAHAISQELDDDLPHAGPSPEATLVIERRARTVRNAVMELTEIQREVILLFQFQGLSYAEIGEVLSLPLGTVKSRMHAALTALGKSLASESDEPPTLELA